MTDIGGFLLWCWQKWNMEILETMFRLGLYILRMLKELEIANDFRCEAKYDY